MAPRPTKGKTPGVPQSLDDFPPKVAAALAALSVLHRRFVIVYCSQARGNGKRAAELVGIKGTVFDQANWASQQLRRADVRLAVDEWMQAFAMTAVQITERITDLTQVNPGPFFEISKDGKLQLKAKMTQQDWEEHKHWVKKIMTNDKGTVIELELHDKMGALRDLAKINKMYSDAPIFGFHLYLSQLPDGELLRQLTEAREAEMNPLQPRLPPGEKPLGPGEVTGKVIDERPPEEPDEPPAVPLPAPLPPTPPPPVKEQEPVPVPEPEPPPVPMETYIAKDGTTRTRPVPRHMRRYGT